MVAGSVIFIDCGSFPKILLRLSLVLEESLPLGRRCHLNTQSSVIKGQILLSLFLTFQFPLFIHLSTEVAYWILPPSLFGGISISCVAASRILFQTTNIFQVNLNEETIKSAISYIILTRPKLTLSWSGINRHFNSLQK